MAEIDISLINRRAKDDASGFISECERDYKDFVGSVADRVANNENIKVILLAGPSGSGKTTTANLLSDELEARGLERLRLRFSFRKRQGGRR